MHIMAKKASKKKSSKKTGRKTARKTPKKAARKTVRKSVKKATSKKTGKSRKKKLMSAVKKTSNLKSPFSKLTPKKKSLPKDKKTAGGTFQATCLNCNWRGFETPEHAIAVQDGQFHEAEMALKNQGHTSAVHTVPLPETNTQFLPLAQ
jgi:hypothetical protein